MTLTCVLPVPFFSYTHPKKQLQQQQKKEILWLTFCL